MNLILLTYIHKLIWDVPSQNHLHLCEIKSRISNKHKNIFPKKIWSCQKKAVPLQPQRFFELWIYQL